MKRLIPIAILLFCCLAGLAQEEAAESPLHDRISLYPNPVHKMLSIEVTDYDYEYLTFKVKDLTGQGVYTKRLDPIEAHNNVYELDLTTLPIGIYIVDIVDEENGEAIVKRLIKK